MRSSNATITCASALPFSLPATQRKSRDEERKPRIPCPSGYCCILGGGLPTPMEGFLRESVTEIRGDKKNLKRLGTRIF